MTLLEEMLDHIFSGRTLNRELTPKEMQSVMDFRRIFSEILNEGIVQKRFDAAEARKTIRYLEEQMAVLDFVRAIEDEVRHPMSGA